MDPMLRHQINRHPFITGVFFLIFGPYLIAFALVIAVCYGLIALAELVGGRR